MNRILFYKGYQSVGIAKYRVINFPEISENAKWILVVQLLIYFMETDMLLNCMR